MAYFARAAGGRRLKGALRLSVALSALLAFSPANAISLTEAVVIGCESNPEIGQAIQNREAIQFELRQAAGLFLPRVDLEAGVGARRLDNETRRARLIEDDPLYPADVGITVRQTLFDGWERRAELERQASRVDGASFRVLERSEFIALQIAREYFEIVLQHRVIAASQENVAFHQRILADIQEGVSAGSLTEADRQQAEERLFAARAQLRQAEEDLASARIRFNALVGVPIGDPAEPPGVSARLPQSLDSAVGVARQNNPRIKIGYADLDAAEALVKKARSAFYPRVSIEGRALAGHDIDGVEDRTTDLEARLVLTWNIYSGGIRPADEQEQIRRASEERLRIHQIYREVEEAVRISWERKHRQAELAQLYASQSRANEQLVGSYREQFLVGQRSLLDVLDAQNTRFNTAVLRDTAAYASRFADYRLLAATGTLLSSLNVKNPYQCAPQQATAETRAAVGVPPTPPAETHRRTKPAEGAPLDLLDGFK